MSDIWEECSKCGTRVKSKNMGDHMTKHKRRMPQRRARKRSRGYTTLDKAIDSKWWNRALVTGLVALVIVLAVMFWPAAPPKLQVGDPAPEITWSSGSLSDFQGRAVVLIFYQPDTKASQDEFVQDYVPLYETWVLNPQLEGRDYFVDFISVTVDVNDPQIWTQADLFQFKADSGALWQFLLDPGSRATNIYTVTGTPTTFILDERLIVRYIFVGTQTYQTYDQAIFNTIRKV